MLLNELAESISAGLIRKSLSKCSRWAEKTIIMPEPYAGPFGYENFPWLREILDIEHGMVSIRKGSQLGLSVAAMVKALYIVTEKKNDMLYVLPTQKLCGDFTTGRLEPLIKDSEHLKDLWDVANVGLRRTHAGKTLYIRGSKAEAGLISIPLGSAVLDEQDRLSANTLSMVLKRFSARMEYFLMTLSTPTLPGHGIDEIYKQGTKERFMFKCPGCSKTIQLQWPESVEICGDHHDSDDCARSRFRCTKCDRTLEHEDKPVFLKKALWLPTEKAHYHRSFHLPQLYSPGMTAEKLVREFHKGEVSEIAKIEFHNQGLGLPYLMEGARVTDLIIDGAKRGHKKTDPRPNQSGRLLVMGVDTGSYLDVVISEYLFNSDPGNEPSINSKCKVLWEGRLAGTDWASLDLLMSEWQVQHCVIDSMPEHQLACQFARRFPGHVSLAQFRKGTTGDEVKTATDENGVETVTVHRTDFMDLALGRFHDSRIELPSDLSGAFREHVKALSRTYERDSEGKPRAVYVSVKDDHLALCLVYCEVALHKAYSRSTGRPMKVGESFHQF